ncbi:MAG: glycosyltransferase family 4 protein [Bellilinea sp.]
MIIHPEPANPNLKIILTANTDWYLYNFRLSLAAFLRQKGWQVVMVSPGGQFARHIETAGFRWLEWQVGRRSMNPLGETRALLRLWQLYRQEKPDLAHHLTIKPVLYGSLAAALSGVPAVVNAITGLGYLFLNDRWSTRLARAPVRLAYRWLLNRSNTAVIFENDANRQQFIREGLASHSRVHLIEGAGVDVERFSPQPEPDGVPVILFPARLLREKGLHTLVEAARLLKRRCAARILLAGDVDEGNLGSVSPDEVRGWVDEGLVEWLGWQADMPAVYAASNLVALPSWGEGIPTALLEAGASARAVVTTDAPGCRDVVEDGYNGWIVPVEDAPALAHALQRLIDDPLRRRQMAANGRQRVVERFSDGVINHLTWQVYCRLLAQRNRVDPKRPVV